MCVAKVASQQGPVGWNCCGVYWRCARCRGGVSKRHRPELRMQAQMNDAGESVTLRRVAFGSGLAPLGRRIAPASWKMVKDMTVLVIMMFN
jgi:hypothetical protein